MNNTLDSKIYWGESEINAAYDKAKFQEFQQQSPEQIKQACTDKNGRLKHIIRAEHFDLEFLETICETAKAARRVAKLEDKYLKSLLTGKSVLNYFAQESSRTFLSFSTAQAHLGMRREDVRDIKTSSQMKGEPEKDSLRTHSSYFNSIVCRHPSDVYDLFAIWALSLSDRSVSFVNAGSGSKEHPTQGILDYYTFRESHKEGLDGKSFAFVGDALRGRTIHSNMKILTLHQDITIYSVAPKHLQLDEETETYLQQKGTKLIKVTDGLKDVVPLIDGAIYMTRIQDEHDKDKGKQKYDPKFIFEEEMLNQMRPGAILTHPLPKREEIAPGIDYYKKDPRIMLWRAVRNGMWTRAATFAYLFGVDDQIRGQYERIKKAAATP